MRPSLGSTFLLHEEGRWSESMGCMNNQRSFQPCTKGVADEEDEQKVGRQAMRRFQEARHEESKVQ